MTIQAQATGFSGESAGEAELRRCAFVMLGCVLTLLAVGAVMVYSASAAMAAEKLPGAYLDLAGAQAASLEPLKSHAGKIGLGLLLLCLGAWVDYRHWMRWSPWLYGLSIVLLALVLVPGLGAKINGSRRWFQADFLPFAFQPSESAKIALLLLLSAHLARAREQGATFWRGFVPGALMVLAPALLILVETDFGTFLLLSMLGFSLMVIAGVRLHYVLLLLGAALPVLSYWVITRLPYVVQRFTSFQEPDPASQIGFGLSALSVGGLTGVGLGGGRYKLFYLAEAENDFILSVIGEELGFLGTSVVILLFATLLLSGGRILRGLRHSFGFFLVAGILLTIATQALINLAVATACVPVKGMPLPFVSSGGSSLTVLCFGVGLVLSVVRHSSPPPSSLAFQLSEGPACER